MDFRTDLALERHELIEKAEPQGVESNTFEESGAKITVIKVTDDRGAKALGKPMGTYITAEIPSLIKNALRDETLIEAVARRLRALLPDEGTILAIGLGNTAITPDAVGPKSADMILATRHITDNLSQSIGLGNLRPVAVIAPGVLGKTGVETAETIRGICEAIKPSAIIVIDALAARKLSRLGSTIQMSDTGIIPGSGVGNARSAITEETMGVPVISVGIPTVVDAETLVNDLTGDMNGISAEENRKMIITPRETDLVTERAAEIIGLAVNKALQPQLSVSDILMLVAD